MFVTDKKKSRELVFSTLKCDKVDLFRSVGNEPQPNLTCNHYKLSDHTCNTFQNVESFTLDLSVANETNFDPFRLELLGTMMKVVVFYFFSKSISTFFNVKRFLSAHGRYIMGARNTTFSPQIYGSNPFVLKIVFNNFSVGKNYFNNAKPQINQSNTKILSPSLLFSLNLFIIE